jgi:hypothetical protein
MSTSRSSEGIPLRFNLKSLKKSANYCDLCNLFSVALADVSVQGIKHGSIQLYPWASDAEGDPIGMSRVFVKIGEVVGRFVDVSAEPGMFYLRTESII